MLRHSIRIVLASGALPLIDFPAIFGHEGSQINISSSRRRPPTVTVEVKPQGKKMEIGALTFLLQNKKYVGVIEGNSVPNEVSRPHFPKLFVPDPWQFIPRLV
jgi:hypothetical protein